MIAWPKAAASAVRACSHCSSCTAYSLFTELRIIHILFPFPPMPYVTWSACALAGRWKSKRLVYSNGSSCAQLACEVTTFKLVSFVRVAFLETLRVPLPLLHVPAQSMPSSLLLPREILTLGQLLCGLVYLTLRYRCFDLYLNPALKSPPLVFGNFQFLLVGY